MRYRCIPPPHFIKLHSIIKSHNFELWSWVSEKFGKQDWGRFVDQSLRVSSTRKDLYLGLDYQALFTSISNLLLEEVNSLVQWLFHCFQVLKFHSLQVLISFWSFQTSSMCLQVGSHPCLYKLGSKQKWNPEKAQPQYLSTFIVQALDKGLQIWAVFAPKWYCRVVTFN